MGHATTTLTRRRLEGVGNILRFNWPVYAAGATGVFALVAGAAFLQRPWSAVCTAGAAAATLVVLSSLLVSAYVYDWSGLYCLRWLDDVRFGAGARLVNINAGFDETSALLAAKYPNASLRVLDFFDPAKHTEPSIRRARACRGPYRGTENISTTVIPLQPDSVDGIFLLFAAHEMRDDAERVAAFTQLHRALTPGGTIVVLEHLRDLSNALAYTAGVFHFYSRGTWRRTFSSAGLAVAAERKVTPFVQLFLLRANGGAH